VTAQKRRLLYLVLALVIGVALAAAVIVTRGGSDQSGSAGPLVTTTVAAEETSEDEATVDPAKQEPLLDKFSSKDPFIPLPTTSPTPTPSASPTTPADQTLTAKITVDGASYTVSKGDKIPSGTPIFTVSSITSSGVTFALIDGEFENGDTSLTINVGESVKVTKEGGASYIIKVVSVDSSGGSSVSGHSIKVLSITESNGTAMVTLEIDGTTYADKEVGDTFTTGWGEIKILAINVDAQTVTIMRGDQTITLSAGQTVVK
jgi:hypothetical protein